MSNEEVNRFFETLSPVSNDEEAAEIDGMVARGLSNLKANDDDFITVFCPTCHTLCMVTEYQDHLKTHRGWLDRIFASGYIGKGRDSDYSVNLSLAYNKTGKRWLTVWRGGQNSRIVFAIGWKVYLMLKIGRTVA